VAVVKQLKLVHGNGTEAVRAWQSLAECLGIPSYRNVAQCQEVSPSKKERKGFREVLRSHTGSLETPV
jgi:hypothetical protein